MPSLCKHYLALQMQKDPNTIWTRAENRPNRKPKNSFTSPLESTQNNPIKQPKQPQSTIFGATEHMPSLCKHHLDTADAKRPKHHLDTSRKPPKPQAKKLFHVTFGIHIKQSKTATEHMPSLCVTRWCLGLFASAMSDGVCIGWACGRGSLPPLEMPPLESPRNRVELWPSIQQLPRRAPPHSDEGSADFL